MQLQLQLNGIQHIPQLDWAVDLDSQGLTCIVGRNGCGKTTLAKALLTLLLADTFAKTSSEGIFRAGSSIVYRFGQEQFTLEYDEALGALNSRQPVPTHVKSLVGVELPIPHGERFKFFLTVSEVDHEIRRAVILQQGTSPRELIDFLARIYQTDRFETMVEVKVRGRSFYCIPLPEQRYLREDYLSSGEYFLISLYRRILRGKKLLFIDEIDISLDAAAQARLATELRQLCVAHGVHLVFTTHSMAMMSTLQANELLYMEREDQTVTLRAASFSYVKSLMFGFKGWDKYILTEDEVLRGLVLYIVSHYCGAVFYEYAVIEIGGSGNVVDLMQRNAAEGFFGAEGDVISILDGDQRGKRPSKRPNTYCVPIESVEKSLLDEFNAGNLPIATTGLGPYKDGKACYDDIVRRRKLMSGPQVCEFLCSRHDTAMRQFATTLTAFLGPPGALPVAAAG